MSYTFPDFWDKLESGSLVETESKYGLDRVGDDKLNTLWGTFVFIEATKEYDYYDIKIFYKNDFWILYGIGKWTEKEKKLHFKKVN